LAREDEMKKDTTSVEAGEKCFLERKETPKNLSLVRMIECSPKTEGQTYTFSEMENLFAHQRLTKFAFPKAVRFS
jgi:hypothetical protein